VVLTGFENDPSSNGIETALAFEFGKIAVTVQPPTANGRPGAPQTASFDASTLKLLASLSPNDLVFDPQTSGLGPIQGALLAPDTLGSVTPADRVLHPTLAAAPS
jgi:hypothetical protein